MKYVVTFIIVLFLFFFIGRALGASKEARVWMSTLFAIGAVYVVSKSEDEQ